ncbi:hypothetical protein [Hymenobacter psychrophilus]|nr:hypothetical protein [Hymenobacter psychrophilus]
MENAATFLTIKQAAQQVNRSEQTIRRLVKQYVKTSHIQTELTPKGNTYLISQTFLAQQYPSQAEPLPAVTAQAQVPEVAELERQLAERDQTIQQLQNRLLEQNDVLNALTSQVNSQRIGRIEELLLSQNEQLGELQKRLPEPREAPIVLPVPESIKRGFWQRVFGK